MKEREPTVNISHRELPDWDEHLKFVNSNPYRAWYFIEAGGIKGACYLSKQNEIGVFVFKAHQGFGYGKKAISAIIKKHGPGRYLANINPANDKSIKLFGSLGFELCQYTYRLDV
jgi:RimJ/RimL family protein N-acetyltransferase